MDQAVKVSLTHFYLVSRGWLGADRHGPEALPDVAAQAHRPPAVLAPVAGVAKGVIVAMEPPRVKPTPENRVRVRSDHYYWIFKKR